MTSYLQNLTSSFSTPTFTTPNISSIQSTLSTRLTTLRKTLVRGSETDDPEDADCSHVSNVLRAYYTEKGRPFPPWLPPDPRAPAPPPPPPPVQQQVGYGYGGINTYNQPNQAGGGGGRGGLSDLWDNNPPQQQQAPPQPQSLRRGPQLQRPSIASQNMPRSSSGSVGSYGGDHQQQQQQQQSSLNVRPLPSQKAGSYQQRSDFGRVGSTSSQGSSGGSAQDRLRARLQGGKSNSPTPPSSAGGTSTPSAQSYSQGQSYGGSQGGGGSQQPYTGARNPWETGDDGYGSSGGGGGGGYGSSAYGGGASKRSGTPGGARGLPSALRPGGPR